MGQISVLLLGGLNGEVRGGFPFILYRNHEFSSANQQSKPPIRGKAQLQGNNTRTNSAALPVPLCLRAQPVETAGCLIPLDSARANPDENVQV